MTKCDKIIKPSKLIYEKKYWQVLETFHRTFKIFNAYYDGRDYLKNQNQSSVKIMAMVDRRDLNIKIYGQLWFDGLTEPIFTMACKYLITWKRTWRYNREGYEPYLIICQNPLQSLNLIPSSVSLVENPCDDATNNFKIIFKPVQLEMKKNFAVCTQLYHYKDFNETIKLIEWIEIILLFGADQIIFHVIDVQPVILSILKFYEAKGKVKIEMMSLPDDMLKDNPDTLLQNLRLQTNQNQMIALNDCLYKNMYNYQFLVPLDIDEIIVPTRKNEKTWGDLLDRKTLGGKMVYNSYIATSSLFLTNNNHQNELQPEIPSHLFFLQNVYRSSFSLEPTDGPKSFQNTAEVEVMHNHFPMFCFNIPNDHCRKYFFKEEDAKLHHYRHSCPRYLNS